MFSLLLTSALAFSQIYVIDRGALEKQARERIYVKISGRAQRTSTDETGQLTIYIRNCGQVAIPKNKKGVAPKEGQLITVFMKERCRIEDWE